MADAYVPYDGPVVTRAEAVTLRLPRYFTGKTCKNGHLSEKKTGKRHCIECERLSGLPKEVTLSMKSVK